MADIMVFLFCVSVRGECSFYWYWWNCWPSLFNFLFIILSKGRKKIIKQQKKRKVNKPQHKRSNFPN